MRPSSPPKTPVVLIVFAWVVVVAPLSWGVYQSIEKAMPLFMGIKSP